MKVKMFVNGEVHEVRKNVSKWARKRYLEGVASWYANVPGPWDMGLYTEEDNRCTHFIAHDGEEIGPVVKVRRFSFG